MQFKTSLPDCEECYSPIPEPTVFRNDLIIFGPFTCPVCKRKVCMDCTNHGSDGPCVECEEMKKKA